MPTNQVFWYLAPQKTQQLKQDINVDVVVIGGGMAGITAAQSFRKKGCSVALIEKYFCGAGATGKSSGFITPDSELDLSYFKRMYDLQQAYKLWEFAIGGVQLIEKNNKDFDLQCDYKKHDILVVANKQSDVAGIHEEHLVRQELRYQSNFYDQQQLHNVIGSSGYYGGVSYGGSFGIRAYAYVQQMKNVLRDHGVAVYEETPALSIGEHTVTTPHATIQAEYVVVCTDRWIPELGKLTQDIYHAQTFLMVSTPLSDDQIKKIFPTAPLMVWDTDLVYQYYRLIEDNRLLVGGGSLLSMLAKQPSYNATSVYRKLTSYIAKKFPDISLRFAYRWPGLIGISKDVMPCAGRDSLSSSIYYIGAAMGLPWAAALGNYSAEHLIDHRTDFDSYFSPARSFPIGHGVQKIIGNRATFAVSNGITMFIKPLLHHKA